MLRCFQFFRCRLVFVDVIVVVSSVVRFLRSEIKTVDQILCFCFEVVCFSVCFIRFGFELSCFICFGFELVCFSLEAVCFSVGLVCFVCMFTCFGYGFLWVCVNRVIV